MPPPWFLYALILLCFYLGVVEPILERVLKKELILEHFWVPADDRLTRTQRKRLLVASYLASILLIADVIYFDGNLNVRYEFQIGDWSIYLPIPFLLYLGIVEPILERVLKKELMLTHFWILPSETLTDNQLKRRWIVAYLGAIFILLAMSGLLDL